MNENADDKKLDWMYKGANSLVNREEYLLGKPVDKQLEQLNQEERDKKLGLVPPKNHVEHECIPPSIRDFNKILQVEQVDLSAKLQEDPLVAIRKREEEARRQFLQNPIQLKKLQEALKEQESKKTKKKKKKQSKELESDSDLDQKIASKLKVLKGNPLAIGISKKDKKRKEKDNSIDIILMHKYNELKDKLSQKDMDDILAGRTSSSSDSDENTKNKRKNSSSSSEEERIKKLGQDKGSRRATINKNENRNKHRRSQSSDSSEEREKYKSNDYKAKYKRTDRRNSSSENDNKYRRYQDKKHNNESYHKSRKDKKDESESSEDERYRSSEKQQGSTKENNRVGRREYRKDSSEERNTKTKKRSISSPSSDRAKKKSKSDDKYLQSKKRECNRYSSDEDNNTAKKRGTSVKKKKKIEKKSESSEDDRKKRKRRSKREGSSSSDESVDERKRNAKIFDKKKNKDVTDCDNSSRNLKPTTESELDQIILQKLRMLRNESDKKENESIETNEEQVFSHYNSDDDEHVYKRKSFGLVRADGTKIALKGVSQSNKPVESKHLITPKEPERKRPKKLSDKEKEELRKQMMRDAEYREKERSINLRKYREEDEVEEKERKTKDFDKNFMHKELLKSTKDASVESRIKSKLNNIQRSSRDMASNFSKRH